MSTLVPTGSYWEPAGTAMNELTSQISTLQVYRHQRDLPHRSHPLLTHSQSIHIRCRVSPYTMWHPTDKRVMT